MGGTHACAVINVEVMSWEDVFDVVSYALADTHAEAWNVTRLYGYVTFTGKRWHTEVTVNMATFTTAGINLYQFYISRSCNWSPLRSELIRFHTTIHHLRSSGCNRLQQDQLIRSNLCSPKECFVTQHLQSGTVYSDPRTNFNISCFTSFNIC